MRTKKNIYVSFRFDYSVVFLSCLIEMSMVPCTLKNKKKAIYFHIVNMLNEKRYFWSMKENVVEIRVEISLGFCESQIAISFWSKTDFEWIQSGCLVTGALLWMKLFCWLRFTVIILSKSGNAVSMMISQDKNMLQTAPFCSIDSNKQLNMEWHFYSKLIVIKLKRSFNIKLLFQMNPNEKLKMWHRKHKIKCFEFWYRKPN